MTPILPNKKMNDKKMDKKDRNGDSRRSYLFAHHFFVGVVLRLNDSLEVPRVHLIYGENETRI